MFNKISFSAIAAMAAFSMVSLTACGDENSDITGASGESALSSSSAPLIELSSSSSGGVVNLCEPLTEGAITRFWVKDEGDIRLTCDTAGVAVGDTCVKQNSINIFQAGMNPTGEIVSFVYQGDGVWTKIETEEMARIDK